MAYVGEMREKVEKIYKKNSSFKPSFKRLH